MCGIFLYIQKLKKISEEKKLNIKETFDKLKKRGPDNSKLIMINNMMVGFHRLSIMDKSILGNQPFQYHNITLICNGEIFNYNEIIEEYDFKCFSKSDCEVILHLYELYKKSNNDEETMYKLCNKLDGEFSFCLYDNDTKKTFIGRDPYGVRPLFYNHDSLNYIVFASEMKGLYDLSENNENQIRQFVPGKYMIYDNNREMIISYNKYISDLLLVKKVDHKEEEVLKNINKIFKEAVYKRIMSDREICCLLSGGLDSSLVASIVCSKFEPNTVKTYSIGLKGSPDLYYSQIVADHIKSDHTIIELTEEEFLNSIEETIKVIESYDITSVRASVGNYLVSKYIKDNSDCKVVFNGDYSDEVLGGYIYFNKCDDINEFNIETKRLVTNICYFDSLRSDRSVSQNGLEARVPFADKKFIEYIFSINPELKLAKTNNYVEKYLLRKAFENDNLLPNEILWRHKEAFSDGVSSQKRSWFQIIQEYVSTKITDYEFEKRKNEFLINKPMTKEAYYYRKIYNKYYNNTDQVIPYYWLPKYSDGVTDPSARTLDNYKE
jgi:asparagine synthase (glutamine-hydrolysing)